MMRKFNIKKLAINKVTRWPLVALLLLLMLIAGGGYAAARVKSGIHFKPLIYKSQSPLTLSYPGPKTYTAGIAVTLTPGKSGVGSFGYSTTATQLSPNFKAPFGLAADAAGNIYVADYHNGVIKIPAGNGTPVNIGFNAPTGVAVDAAGNLYVAQHVFYSSPDDENGYFEASVWKLPPGSNTPIQVDYGDSESFVIGVDPTGNLFMAENDDSGSYSYLQELPAGSSSIHQVYSDNSSIIGTIACDAVGNVFFSDGNGLTEIPAGNGTPVNHSGLFANSLSTTFDAANNIYAVEGATGMLQTIAEGNLSGTPVTIGPAFSNPDGVAIDGAGNIDVSSYNGNSATGFVSQLKPSGGYFIVPALPSGLSLNKNTGIISGTPTTASSATNYTVTAYNSSGSTSATVNIKVLPSPALSAFKIDRGVLTPAFSPGTTSYTANVVNGVTSFTITPTTSDPAATVKVNGTAVVSGMASASIPLSVGTHVISTKVTASDGITTKIYTLSITRAPSNNVNLSSLKISRGTLSPVFSAANTSYTASVVNGVTSVTVTPTSVNAAATITVNDTIVTSGTASGPIALSVGTNTITTVVTSQDGTITNTYNVTITRAAAPTNITNESISAADPVENSIFDNDGVIVHRGLSPNGDGINDYLVIDGIQTYPDNKLTVMTRNGSLVFETKGYDNASKVFDGHSNKNGQMQLPGTYFYSLDYTVKGVVRHKTGFIILKY